MTSYLEDFTEKLGLMSIDSNRYLRHIRMLDVKIEELKPALQARQKEFVEKVKLIKDKKQEQKALEQQLQQIQQMEKLLYGMSLQKVKVSQQLHEVVTEALHKIDGELGKLKSEQKKNGGVEEDREERENPLKKKKQKDYQKQQQKHYQNDKEWLYDRTEAKYCYCGSGSHGEMVECEDPFCEREWFHRSCITDKTLPEQWFCNDCKKLKEKLKSGSTRAYVS